MRFLAALVLTATTLPAQSGKVFADYAKPRMAKVEILALSTASHQSWAGNQDTYLADLSVKEGQHDLIRLVDLYPGYANPILPSVLKREAILKLQVVRETACDRPASEFYLSGVSAVFDASAPDRLKTLATNDLPCYRTVHRSIRLAKNK